MILLSDLKIDIKSFGDDMMLVGVKPYADYVNGVKSNEITGYKYEVVLPQMRFEKISVKIPGAAKSDFPANSRVQFENLKATAYSTSNGTIGVSATASKISLLPGK